MFSKIRSLIFKIDPEKAHTLAIKSLKLNFRDLIANPWAVSGSNLKIKDLKFEYIIWVYSL